MGDDEDISVISRRQEPSEEFEKLLRKNLDSLYRTALRLTCNRLEAEELVQEASVRAFRRFDLYRQGTNARAWLLTVLRNVFINDYRRKAKERDILASLQAEPHPERQEMDFPEAVAGALRRLPEDQRLAVSLFYVEGLSYKEIAEAMDCPAGTVMSRLHAARKKLIKSVLPPRRPGRKEAK